jgi:hypothetical protein
MRLARFVIGLAVVGSVFTFGADPSHATVSYSGDQSCGSGYACTKQATCFHGWNYGSGDSGVIRSLASFTYYNCPPYSPAIGESVDQLRNRNSVTRRTAYIAVSNYSYFDCVQRSYSATEQWVGPSTGYGVYDNFTVHNPGTYSGCAGS